MRLEDVEQTLKLSKDVKSASDDDWSTEYLAPIISIKIVKDLDEAIKHIREFGTGHTNLLFPPIKLPKINSPTKLIVQLLWLTHLHNLPMVVNLGLVGK